MTYLVYRDEKAVKCAREDGRLDQYTKYYRTHFEIETWLKEMGLVYKVIENDQPVPLRLH